MMPQLTREGAVRLGQQPVPLWVTVAVAVLALLFSLNRIRQATGSVSAPQHSSPRQGRFSLVIGHVHL